MSTDTERVLGELKEFKRAADLRLDKIEKKIDGLTAFKWRVTGYIGAVYAVVIGGWELLKFWLVRSQ